MKTTTFEEDLAKMQALCDRLGAKDGKTYRPIVEGKVVISNMVSEVMRPPCPTCGK